MVLAGQALGRFLGIGNASAVLAFAGLVVMPGRARLYRTIHTMGRVSSIVGVLAFLYLFASLLHGHDIGALPQNRHFTVGLVPARGVLVGVVADCLWALMTADYSRYLPRSTSALKTFFAVGAGSALGAQVSMVFGVFCRRACRRPLRRRHEVSFIVGLGASGAVAALLYLTIALGKLTITTLNAYGSVMSVAAIITGFGGQRTISSGARLGFILLMVGLSTVLALAGEHAFLKEFSAFLLFLLAFFTPWSAINLVDYYFVTRERYDVPALSDPDGRYGRWNMTGIVVYAVGVLVQMP
ncbi:cytosine permease [Cupriavidus basilensis]